VREGWRDELARLEHTITTLTAAEIRTLIDRFRKRRETEQVRRFAALIEPAAWAGPGERDNTLYSMLRSLAEEYPHASADSVAALFAPSAQIMEATHPVDVPILDAVRTKWERLTRAVRERADEDRANGDRLRSVAWSWVEHHGRSDAIPLGAAPIIVHHAKAVFVRIGDRWAGPWTRDELTPGVLGSLEALYRVEIPDVPTLLRRHSERASRMEYSFQVRRTVYDMHTKEITAAVAPIRTDLEPSYSPAVASMIAEIGGQYAAHLTWWLASFAQDGPCRALILSGEPGVGKSLLLRGLGRLWRDGYSKAINILGKRFNSEAAASRLAVADDETGATEAGHALAAYLREAVDARVQSVERKHHDVSKVRGSLRFAIATNDVHELVRGAVSHTLNNAAVDAFGDRLLHIPIPAEARGCWERAGVTPAELAEGDVIARHVLWLGLHDWGPMGGDRFWVQAGDTELAGWLKISSGLRGDILLRLEPELGRRLPSVAETRWGVDGLGPWCASGDGGVWVSARGLYEQWGDDRPRSATPRTIGAALKGLAGRPSMPYHGRRLHLVPADLIREFAAFSG
jgi:hypothetical protein